MEQTVGTSVTVRRSTSVVTKKAVRKAIRSRIIKNSFVSLGKISFDIEYSPTTQKQWATINKFSKFY